MQENNTNQTEIPELKSGEEIEQEKAERYQRIADELADAMTEGIYPMDVVWYMWEVLENALDRNDVGFNHSAYTKAVIPYLLELNPEYEETVICMTNALVKLRKEIGGKNAQN